MQGQANGQTGGTDDGGKRRRLNPELTERGEDHEDQARGDFFNGDMHCFLGGSVAGKHRKPIVHRDEYKSARHLKKPDKYNGAERPGWGGQKSAGRDGFKRWAGPVLDLRAGALELGGL